MKLKGKKIEGVNIVTIVIPRGDDDSIVLKAQAILNYDEFNTLCPKPVAKTIIKKGERVEDTESKVYQDAWQEYAQRKAAYTLIKSLQATPDLEWETVKLEDANTWMNYSKELTAAGFTEAEQFMILQGVMTANGLNDAKIEEARNSFLAGLAAEQEKA